jgi:two-component system nitrate/nitrite response regulator NarL
VAATRLFRDGLADALSDVPDVDVVATARSAGEALARISEYAPAIALVDTGGVEGTATVHALVRGARDVDVIALAVPEHEDEIVALAEAGAGGYVTRDASLEDLVAVVRCVTRGETLCSPRIAATLFRRVAALAADRRVGDERTLRRLTRRERQIVDLIADGLSNKEIAHRLQIEFATVKNHVHNILEKLQVTRRADAVAALRRAD